MSGIYLHIPFCRKACRYCDFHFSVSLGSREEMVKSIAKELVDRKDYLGEAELGSIYFGGGTPSVLPESELGYLMSVLKKFNISDEAEISFETNPDDLSEDYLRMLSNNGINRLSIGIQSFSDDDLMLMRRSHNAKQAFHSVERAIMMGFENISIDLIYGVPGMDLQKWERNLDIAISMSIPHISAYHLTFEPRTVFNHWVKKGRLLPISEEESMEQFSLLREKLSSRGLYHHYEISNFAKEGYYSRHNTNYWKQIPYLGVGPSAHSYNGSSRRWNISSNSKYIDFIKNGSVYFEEEELSKNDLYNEYLMTSLRTAWGVDSQYLMNHFGRDKFESFLLTVQKHLSNETILKEGLVYKLSDKGIFLADGIISDLFINDFHS
jgi:oxygen-independent coproporphyrinogen III oxidase